MRVRWFIWMLLSGALLALAGCRFEGLQGRWSGFYISTPDDGAHVPLGEEVVVTVKVETDVPAGLGQLFIKGPDGEHTLDLPFVRREDDLYEGKAHWVPTQTGEYTLWAEALMEDGQEEKTEEIKVVVDEARPIQARPAQGQLSLVSPTPLPMTTPTPTPTRGPTKTPSPTGTPTPTPLPCLRAKFVADVTVPDGTRMEPGQTFTKTWRLQNTGSCAWTPQFAVVFDSGDRMNAAEATPIGQTVAPGQTVDVSVELTAPQNPGTYRANFKLRSPEGEVFGLGDRHAAFYVEIKVAALLPDLAVRSLTYSPDPYVIGQEASLTLVVVNQGDGPAGPFGVSWLNVHTAHAATCAWDVNGLAAGQQTTLQCTIPVGTYRNPGEYTTMVILDVGNRVAESNEDNNEYRQAYRAVQGDTTGPSIKGSRSSNEIYWPSGCGPNEVTIQAYVGDPSGVAWVRVRYRVINENNTAGQWVTRDMALVGTNQYQYVLTGADLRASLDPPLHYGQGRVEYTILAADRVGNTSEQPQPNLTLYYCLR